jgi:hypothetical protein
MFEIPAFSFWLSDAPGARVEIGDFAINVGISAVPPKADVA